LLFCKIVVQSIFLSFVSKHLLYNSYILSFDNLGSLIGSFFFGVSSLLLVLNKLWAIALPTPNEKPCFIVSTIEGGCVVEGECEGACIIVGTDEGAGEGGGAGERDDFEFVRFDADLGIYLYMNIIIFLNQFYEVIKIKKKQK
jgi:hypothetical protein